MKSYISLSEAMKLASRAVKEYGDNHRMRGLQCYFVGGRPQCFLGVIFSYMGLTNEDFSLKYYSPIHGIVPLNRFDINSLVACGYLQCDDLTLKFLRAVQNAQDEGECWLNAYNEGVDVVFEEMGIQMGDIGDDQREIEFVPVPETAPAKEPIPEYQPAEEPVKEPEKVPV